MNEEDYAIVVGINRYPALTPLVAAEDDAQKFRDWLIDPARGALPPQNVTLILSSNYPAPAAPIDAHPIKHDVDRALTQLVGSGRKRIGRRLYFYFSGHGLGLNFDEIALVMANAAEGMYFNIGVSKYRTFFRHAAPFDEVVFLLDCCRSHERWASLGPPPYGLKPGDRASKVRDFLALASRFGKSAFERPVPGTNRKRGLFTQALLEGLEEGKAANPVNGEITGGSLCKYLKDRLPELAKAEGLAQEPEFEGDPPDIVFCTVEIPKLHVQIEVPAGLTGELILSGGLPLQEIARRAAADTPWTLDLLRGLYEIQHADTGKEYQFKVESGKEQIHVSFD